MNWYDYLIYATVLIGFLTMLLGVHKIKFFKGGLIIILLALIAKLFIWIMVT